MGQQAEEQQTNSTQKSRLIERTEIEKEKQSTFSATSKR